MPVLKGFCILLDAYDKDLRPFAKRSDALRDIPPGSSLTRRNVYQSIKDDSPQIFNNLCCLRDKHNLC